MCTYGGYACAIGPRPSPSNALPLFSLSRFAPFPCCAFILLSGQTQRLAQGLLGSVFKTSSTREREKLEEKKLLLRSRDPAALEQATAKPKKREMGQKASTFSVGSRR